MLRTHNCGELREEHIGMEVKLAGWVDTIRDHGGVIFIDLRDGYGFTQLVIHDDSVLSSIQKETVILISGKVSKRDAETVNTKLATGYVEVNVEDLKVLGKCTNRLPFEISDSLETREDVRLKYRYLDLRNLEMHNKIMTRAAIISFLRKKMESMGFTEIQTPILTASSPEGARDYLVPSRKHKGEFYALPQAPQQFKQLLMVSGFDKYFQIAPCFRDEDARQDRSPGEFYQLDFEMAFAEQEDVLKVAEEVVSATFKEFTKKDIPTPFPRISFRESMLKYGTDKPDLRNPLVNVDLTDFFSKVDFPIFKGKPVRGIVCDCTGRPKSFFERSLKFATEIGMKGLGYLTLAGDDYKGPIAKFLSDEQKTELKSIANIKDGETIFFICDRKEVVNRLAGEIRTWLGENLELIDKSSYRFCYIVDFPMYEYNEEEKKIDFTHNPFSMPQGGLEALNTKDPLDILAYQYDIVCNGVELSSGAVRNHDTDIMKKAFEIAGYSEEVLAEKFGALYTAFSFGAPPHAGMAPGVDRMVMLITGNESIRDVIAFPLNGNAQDVMMGAPGKVTEQQLREVHIRVRD